MDKGDCLLIIIATILIFPAIVPLFLTFLFISLLLLIYIVQTNEESKTIIGNYFARQLNKFFDNDSESVDSGNK